MGLLLKTVFAAAPASWSHPPEVGVYTPRSVYGVYSGHVTASLSTHDVVQPSESRGMNSEARCHSRNKDGPMGLGDTKASPAAMNVVA